MKRSVSHVDKAVMGFQQEQNRIMIRFHKDDSAGRVDDDIQEPVEPRRFVICARDQRGERPSSWEGQAGAGLCLFAVAISSPIHP